MAGTTQQPVQTVRAWTPPVAGVHEVLHARFTEHAYPPHTHDTWTLLVVDAGAVRYDLDRREHRAVPGTVTLLPPHVPHDGRAVTHAGFRKRVVYLGSDQVDVRRTGAVVDRPRLSDLALRSEVDLLHRALADPLETFEATVRLALVLDRLGHCLGAARDTRVDAGVAARLRELLDARVVDGVTLTEAGALLGAHPSHLVRSFTRAYGIAPHRYLTGRRLDRARRLLLDGSPAAEVAPLVGFHDQAHLTRHFRRLLGTTPAAYADSA